MKKQLSILLLGLFAMLLMFGGMGCASTDSENVSSRPWNSPRDWEGGLPPAFMQGR
jgi:hypothetical protein